MILIAHQKAVELLLTGKNDKSRDGGYVIRLIKVFADMKMRLNKE